MTKRNIFLSLLVVVMVMILAGVAVAQDAWNGGRFDGPVEFVLPTTQATATSGVVINGYGLGKILSVQDSGTPVFDVYNGGTINTKLLRYATAGSQLICGSSTVTDTETIATGLTTNTYCWANVNQAVAGDARTANCRTSSGNAIVDVKNSAVTPAANGTGAVVVWCAVGTP